jgi:hypothetical protein
MIPKVKKINLVKPHRDDSEGEKIHRFRWWKINHEKLRHDESLKYFRSTKECISSAGGLRSYLLCARPDALDQPPVPIHTSGHQPQRENKFGFIAARMSFVEVGFITEGKKTLYGRNPRGGLCCCCQNNISGPKLRTLVLPRPKVRSCCNVGFVTEG